MDTEKANSLNGGGGHSQSDHGGHESESTPPQPPQPVSAAPDGGLAAWLVVFGCWCVSFCSFGWLNSIGVFQEYYQNVLLANYSPSTISWIPALQIFFMMGTGPIVGSLYDRYGPRWLLLGGSIMHVFGVMMASLGTKYYQIFLAQGVCSAIGMSTIFQPASACLQGWFSSKRGAAFGIVFTGSSVGGVIFPIMLSRLIRNVGFGWAMRISAFLILGLLIIANLTIRSLHPPSPKKLTKAQLLKPFTEIDFVLLSAGFFLFSFGFFVPVNFLPSQALEAGMSPNLVQYILPILNGASFFGRLFAGFAGDKLGKYNVFTVVSYLSGIWILALWLVSNSQPAIIAFTVLFGFFSGAFISLISPLIMAISSIQEIGFRMGIVLFFSALGGLATNPINGAILDRGRGWDGLKIFSGIFCIIGTSFVFAARMRRTGWNLFVVF